MFTVSTLFHRAMACATLALSATIMLAANAQPKITTSQPATDAGKAAPTSGKIVIPEKMTSVEGITEYRLPNGLKILLFPDQSKPTVTVNITYLVGSRHENYGETGMAHLLEHLLFKGTPKNPSIAKDFNTRGAKWNAETHVDRTNYYEILPATDDNIEWALQMEADRMVNSFIAKKDLDAEMTVVRNEYERNENSPGLVLGKRMQRLLFDWHNYGNTIIGNRSDIENVKIENLQAFYRTYYQPDNAVLLVAGKFDEAKILARISKYFAVVPKPTRVLPTLWTVEPTQDGERSVAVRRKGDVQMVVVAYKIPGALHPDADAIRIAGAVMTDSPNGRLYKALVEKGMAVAVFGEVQPFVDMSYHLIGAVVKKGEALEPVQAELVRLVEDFQKTPPSAEELARVRQSIANDAETMLNDHEKIGLAMSAHIATGDWRAFFLRRDRRLNMGATETQAAASRYYRRDNRVVGLLVPEDNPQRAEIPAAPTAAVALKDFKSSAVASLAEAFDPSIANVTKRSKRADLGGISVALLTKKTRGETVNVSMRFHSGDDKTLFGKAMAEVFVANMLFAGTNKFTRAQLADEINKLKIDGDISGLSANFKTTKSNLSAAIKLAAHMMRAPSFPESEFELLKKQILTSIESQKSDPRALAQIELAKHFNIFPRGDVRYAGTLEETEEDVKAITLQQVRDHHKQLYAASKGEIAVVGDLDEAEVTQAIQEAYGDWKGGVPYIRLAAPFKDVAATNRKIETPDKENAVFVARTNISMQEDDADYPAMLIANYIMGGGAGFESRLTARIRVKDGLSYTAQSALNIESRDRGSIWSASVIAAPQNMEKVEAAFKEEVAKVLKDGFTAAEVAAAKSGTLQMNAQERAQDGNLARKWVSNLDLGRTFDWNAKFEERISTLKAEDVTAAFRKHINADKITIIKTGDFAKVAKMAKATSGGEQTK